MSSSRRSGQKPRVSDWVLDASALLAYIHVEAGAEVVDDALRNGVTIGAVNLTEVVARLTDLGWAETQIHEAVDATSVAIVHFDEVMAFDAGLLRQHTRHAGLSLGDRACLALARRLGASVLTADRAWRDLDVGVPIVLIR